MSRPDVVLCYLDVFVFIVLGCKVAMVDLTDGSVRVQGGVGESDIREHQSARWR